MSSVLAVIVIYNTEISESTAFNSLYRIHELDFVIYDNSPYHQEYKSDNRIKYYIHDKDNGGLSKAYNIAAAYAHKHSYEWILIADQDTCFPLDLLKTYTKAIREYPNIRLFIPQVRVDNGKYLSPVPMKHYNAKLRDTCTSGLIDLAKFAIINSGLLINTAAFLSVGGYNEKVWLDFSDFQFIERFSQKFNTAFVADAVCVQSFSNEEQTINQKLSRYKLFCTSLKHYKPINRSNKLWISVVAFKRCISLCLQARKFTPLHIFLNNYLR